MKKVLHFMLICINCINVLMLYLIILNTTESIMLFFLFYIVLHILLRKSKTAVSRNLCSICASSSRDNELLLNLEMKHYHFFYMV